MSTPFATLDLLAKYIRHDVPIYCHDHPTQPDGMNACVKELESALQAFELPDAAAEIDNPVMLGTLQLRDNAGVFEISDDGATWNPVGGGGIPAEIDNPVSMGTLQLRDNAGVFEMSGDAGETWAEIGSGGGGGVTWSDMGQGPSNTIRFGEWVAIGSIDEGNSFAYTENAGETWKYPLDDSHRTSMRHGGLMLLDHRPFLGAAINSGGVATFLMSTGAYSLGAGLKGYTATLIAQTTGAITITGATYRLGAASGTTLSIASVTVGDFCEMLYSDGTDSINAGWWILATRGSWAVS